MCKVGGPRCPQTEGKKNSRRARDRVNALIEKSGQEPQDWKSDNLYEYDETVRVAFGDEQEEETPTVTNASNDDAAYHQMWLDMLREQEPYLDAEGLAMLQNAEETVEGKSAYPKVEVPTNRNLLPKDAVIKSPTPSPVFVYGTLRAGQGNYSYLLKGCTRREQAGAEMPGGEMYTNGGFPYVIPNDDAESVVKGDLMYLDNDVYLDTMEGLDMLEGTRTLWSDSNHYNRSLQYVKTGDNEYTQAWVYMPPKVDHDRLREGLRRVESGDWADGSVPRWGRVNY